MRETTRHWTTARSNANYLAHMQALGQDLRYALRSIRKSPGLALTAILTLALGIGANTAIFSVVNGVVLRPLAYEDPDELVFIQTGFPNIGFDEFWISAPEYLLYRDGTTTIESMGAFTTGEVSLTGGQTPIRVPVGLGTASLFTTLGVEPLLGRTFTDEEDSPAGPAVTLLAYGLWTRVFGARESVVGETVDLNGVPRTVVGVMPPRFDLDDSGIEVWIPMAWDEANPPGWGSHNFHAVGRLGDGATIGHARAELDVLMPRWAEERADGHTLGPETHEVVLTSLETRVVGDIRPLLLTLLGAVGFVLLIAVANVGNLLLARAEIRQREIALRAALGAGRGRLLRQFITESLLLALVAGAVGLAAGQGALRLLLAAHPESIPRLAEIGLDPAVLLFALAASLATGVLFGLAPLLHLSETAVGQGLGDGSERSTNGARRARLRHLIVVGEVAAAVVLVIGAGLMLRSFSALLRVDPGFDASGTLAFRLYLPPPTYPEAADEVAFFDRLGDELAAIPGVQTVSSMSGLPPIRRVNANTMVFEGITPNPDRQEMGRTAEVDYWQFVMDDYFETMRIPLLEGRLFTPQDAHRARPVVLVNETMARTYWPETGALERRLRPCCGDDQPWLTVVGVVGDVKQGGMNQATGTELYFYLPQAAVTLGYAQRSLNVVLRTSVPPASLAGAARSTVWSLDPSLPIADLQTLDTAVLRSVAQPRFLAVLLGSFGLIALVLAAVGTYGVMSMFVAERTREMGIRMALGAESGRVVRLVLRHGLRIAGTGLLLGVAGALTLNRFLSSMLFGVSGTDPLTYAGVVTLLGAIAVLACVVPARRATRVDPLVALRAE